jgi:hypothetical protein
VAVTGKTCRKRRQVKFILTKVRQQLSDFAYKYIRGDVIKIFNSEYSYWNVPIEAQLPAILKEDIIKWLEKE